MDIENRDLDDEMITAIENLGIELKDRLDYLSKMSEKLFDNGWTGEGGLYDISFYKEQSVDETKKELTKLDIDPRGLDIEEEEWLVEDES